VQAGVQKFERPVDRGQGLVPAHRFLVLDGLRGVAALIVAMHHLPYLFGGRFFARAHLAVDFFFMLSGFVLTFAFQTKLDRGMSTGAFLKRRLIRLYPLYLLGLTLGLVVLLVRRESSHLSAGQMGMLYVLGSLMVPAWTVFGRAWDMIVPFDFPEWSIVYELVANTLHALLLRRRGWMYLLGLIGLSGSLFAVYALRTGDMNVGFQSNTALGPVLRVTFAYFLGVAIYRVWQSGRVRLAVPAVVPVTLFLLCLYAPQWGQHPVEGGLLMEALAFPLVLLLGAQARPWRRMDGVFAGAGAISYPVYVLHVPLVGPFSHVWIRLRGHVPDLDAPWSGIAMLVSLGLLSWGLLALYDSPVRAMLGRWLREGPAP
jgi:peptidoglycan/LPS O-acetylase OafA/YrhL